MRGEAVSCVVVAFHRPDALARLLAALEDERLERVVVNAEMDPAVDSVAQEWGAEVVGLRGNPGYAAAINTGVRQARGEVVIFCNDDVALNADGALRLAAVVRAGEADVAVPRLIRPDGASERSIAALPTPANLAMEWMVLPDQPVPGLRRLLRLEKWRLPDHREAIDAAAATVVACHRSLLFEVPLPESYFLYWEESEWFWRLSRRGTRVVFEPDVVVVHEAGRQDVRPEKSRLLAANAVRCVRRTQGRFAALAAWVVVVAWNLRLVVGDGVGSLVSTRRKTRLGARWAGLLSALRALGELR